MRQKHTSNVILLLLILTGVLGGPKSMAQVGPRSPALNNMAVYSGQIGVETQMIPFEMTMKLVSVDKLRRQYLRETVTVVGGQSQSSNEWIDQGELFSTASFPQILASCRLRGGSVARVTTPAGTFESCQISTSDSTQDSTVWLAPVPFGYVRYESVSRVDGTRSQMILQSFTFGN